MKNLFEEGTTAWYLKGSMVKPLECVYHAPVQVDIGAYSGKHVVSFPDGPWVLVDESDLYACKDEASVRVECKNKKQIEYLETIIAVNKLELKELRGD